MPKFALRKILAVGLTALALGAASVWADNTITHGIDIFQTKSDGNTYVDLSLPAGFFCTGSAAFAGRVTLTGAPIATNPASVLGATDTVIERTADTTFVNNTATVNAVVRAFSFKSSSPISVTGCSGSNLWDVKTRADSSQTGFTVTISRASSSSTGGTFSASVPVNADLTFTQEGSGTTRTATQLITFSTSGAEWTHQPGSGGVTYTSSVQIDSNNDGSPDLTVAGTSNFSAGWSPSTKTGCSTPPCPTVVPHQAPGHSHFTYPPPQYCAGTQSAGTAAHTGPRQVSSALSVRVLPCVAQAQ